MDDQARHRALQIAKNLLESRISALEATGALLPFLSAHPTLAMPEDRDKLLAIHKETDDLPVGRIREEWHPDILHEKDSEIARYEKLHGKRVRSICERMVRHLDRPIVHYMGTPDLYNGFVRSVWREGDVAAVLVQVEGGKRYVVSFMGVAAVEMSAPEDMRLYAISEAPTDVAGIQRYDFINWYYDRLDRPESAAYLRILAARFTMRITDR